jgi:4-carboxymuconolactone decarboxylase
VDFAYGDVWARPGLSFAQRSIVTIAILIALRAHGELRMHLPIGLANGLSVEQIDELLLHALPYAGFPAVVSAGEIWQEFRN